MKRNLDTVPQSPESIKTPLTLVPPLPTAESFSLAPPTLSDKAAQLPPPILSTQIEVETVVEPTTERSYTDIIKDLNAVSQSTHNSYNQLVLPEGFPKKAKKELKKAKKILESKELARFKLPTDLSDQQAIASEKSTLLVELAKKLVNGHIDTEDEKMEEVLADIQTELRSNSSVKDIETLKNIISSEKQSQLEKRKAEFNKRLPDESTRSMVLPEDLDRFSTQGLDFSLVKAIDKLSADVDSDNVISMLYGTSENPTDLRRTIRDNTEAILDRLFTDVTSDSNVNELNKKNGRELIERKLKQKLILAKFVLANDDELDLDMVRTMFIEDYDKAHVRFNDKYPAPAARPTASLIVTSESTTTLPPPLAARTTTVTTPEPLTTTLPEATTTTTTPPTTLPRHSSTTVPLPRQRITTPTPENRTSIDSLDEVLEDGLTMLNSDLENYGFEAAIAEFCYRTQGQISIKDEKFSGINFSDTPAGKMIRTQYRKFILAHLDTEYADILSGDEKKDETKRALLDANEKRLLDYMHNYDIAHDDLLLAKDAKVQFPAEKAQLDMDAKVAEKDPNYTVLGLLKIRAKKNMKNKPSYYPDGTRYSNTVQGKAEIKAYAAHMLEKLTVEESDRLDTQQIELLVAKRVTKELIRWMDKVDSVYDENIDPITRPKKAK